MKPLLFPMIPQIHSQFQRFFPLKTRKALWQEVEPRCYSHRITASALVLSFLIAFPARLSGLRAVVERCGHLPCTDNFSSPSHALRRASSLAFVQRLVGVLESKRVERKDDLIPIDGMALSLPKTQRHHCKKMNDKTVGGGVIWADLIRAAKGVSPVKVLKVVEGAWHEAAEMRTVQLMADGPVYLMDRGFYALDLLEK